MRSLLVGLFLVAGPSGADTLCAANEKVVFSCGVARSKMVSVCRAPDSGQDGGSLAYRFGRAERLELVFPSSKKASFVQFRFAHYFWSQVDRTELNFTIGEAEYSVYDDFEGEEKPATTTRGARVTTSGKTYDLPCIGSSLRSCSNSNRSSRAVSTTRSATVARIAMPHPSDSWRIGHPYERYVGRWSRRVAPAFLSWLAVVSGKRWLDVGCGAGALCEAILEHAEPASLTSIEPSDGFRAVARDTLAAHVILRRGNADALPLPDASVDVVVAGLVLNFITDLGRAFAEMTRVAAPGAAFGAYVWDYARKMELMRHFWDAAVALDPTAATLDEGPRFPLCHSDELLAQVGAAGLRDAEVTALDVATDFVDFDDYWQPFLGGQGPAPAYAMSLSEDARSRLKDHLRRALPIAADGSLSLVARAWAVRATW